MTAISTNRRTIDLTTFLAYVSLYARKQGYVAAKDVKETGKPTTGELVWERLTKDFSQLTSDQLDMVNEVQDKDNALACIEWGKARKNPSGNEFFWKVAMIAESGLVSWADKNIAAAMYSLFDADSKRHANPSGKFLGMVGQKVSARVRLEKIIPYQSTYGAGYLYILLSDRGHNLKWSTNKHQNELEINVGDIFRIDGSVKSQDVYNGQNQTSLTRCKIAKL